MTVKPQDDASVLYATRRFVRRSTCWSIAPRCTSLSTAAPASTPPTSSIIRNDLSRQNTHYEFNVDKAVKLLDDAGWKLGSDGVREKNGVKLHVVFQTSINAPRQKTQEIVKQACQKAGISVEIKTVTSSVFFSSDVANPDTYAHFCCDMQMFTTKMKQPDPGAFMRQFLSAEVAGKANKWTRAGTSPAGRTPITTICSMRRRRARSSQAAALFIAMNDLVIKNEVVIPVVYRPAVSAVSNQLHASVSGWDNNTWALQNWYHDA